MGGGCASAPWLFWGGRRAVCVWIRLEPRVWAGAETNQICTPPPPARSSSATAGDSLCALVVSMIPACGDSTGRPGRKVSGALGLEFTHQLGQNWHQQGGSSLQREQPAGRLRGRRRHRGSHSEFSWRGRARRPPGGGKEQGAWGAVDWPRSMNVLLRAEGKHTAASVPGTARLTLVWGLEEPSSGFTWMTGWRRGWGAGFWQRHDVLLCRVHT